MQFFANKKDSLQNCFLYCLLNGGLYATKITLWGSLKKNRTLKIKSGQEKRALKGSFFQNGGLYATKITLLGSLKKIELSKLNQGKKKEPIKALFFKMVGANRQS